MTLSSARQRRHGAAPLSLNSSISILLPLHLPLHLFKRHYLQPLAVAFLLLCICARHSVAFKPRNDESGRELNPRPATFAGEMSATLGGFLCWWELIFPLVI